MASNPDLVQYIADQCAGAGEITVKKMFGDYGIYCDGVIFGLICDNRFYLHLWPHLRQPLLPETNRGWPLAAAQRRNASPLRWRKRLFLH